MIQVADDVTKTIRSSDLLARLGGDEFAILVDDLKDLWSLEIMLKKLIHIVNREFYCTSKTCEDHDSCANKQKVTLGASLGVVIYPYDGETVSDLKINGDIIMYESKKRGKNQYTFYSEEYPKLGAKNGKTKNNS